MLCSILVCCCGGGGGGGGGGRGGSGCVFRFSVILIIMVFIIYIRVEAGINLVISRCKVPSCSVCKLLVIHVRCPVSVWWCHYIHSYTLHIT